MVTRNVKILWFGALAVVLLAAILYLWQLNGRPVFGIDDASIFLGYAKNVAEGHGITYAGNHTPVEGCTSMAWLLLCSVSYLIGMDAGGVWILQLALFLCTVFVWNAVLRRLVDSAQGSLFAVTVFVALLVSSPGYLTWMAVSLMDVTLWGLLVSGLAYFALLNVQTERARLTRLKFLLFLGLFLVAPWVRPETLMIVPLMLAFLFVVRFLRRYSLKPLWLPLLLFCTSTLALMVFRLVYFGYPFPNTYYAKVSPSFVFNISAGYWYLLGYIVREPRVWLCFVLILAGAQYCVWKRSQYRVAIRFLPLVGLLLLLLLIPVLTGGDHFKQYRFYQPAFPLACVCLAAMLHGVIIRARSLRGCSCGGLGRLRRLRNIPTFLMVLALVALPSEWRYWMRDGSPLAYEFFLAEKGYEIGYALNTWFSSMSARPRVGVITAGGISLAYSGEIVDLMGLNNVVIAHNRGDRVGYKNHAAFEPSLFDSLKIDMIVVEPLEIRDVEHLLKGLCQKPSFTSRWSYGVLSKPDSGTSFRVLVENSFLSMAKEKYGISFSRL